MVRIARWLALPMLSLLAACVATPDAQAPTASAPPHRSAGPVPPTRAAPLPQPVFRQPAILQLPGLETVIDKDANELLRRFGAPQLDVHEGDMRKLQFAGEPCVLDVFLYPLKPGAAPVATYVDARRASDGRDVDRAACIAALMRR
jgi:hypothetical protein